ncbi:hypothetical protein CT0861_08677 [Colletotrichum tofieldiae]|uniref:Uncharacterized protein n=1 Tax=Colletotrichum tofieldiae TaxID=708197 RepID=A0A161WGZ7_9PEZI|nr:hypothetical protein CT0861_08677 [Colletotrichum tofieldiae]
MGKSGIAAVWALREHYTKVERKIYIMAYLNLNEVNNAGMTLQTSNTAISINNAASSSDEQLRPKSAQSTISTTVPTNPSKPDLSLRPPSSTNICEPISTHSLLVSSSSVAWTPPENSGSGMGACSSFSFMLKISSASSVFGSLDSFLVSSLVTPFTLAAARTLPT